METWRQIPTFPAYEVSSLGRVRRLLPGRSTSPMKVLKTYITSKGYVGVGLGNTEGKQIQVLMHRIVCEAFNGPPPSPEHQAAHKDGHKTNNTPDNLRWATALENAADKVRHGTSMKGSLNNQSKLTESDVLQIKGSLRSGVSQRKIAAEFNVSQRAISLISSGHTWRHVR